jgi:hypothetical protein
VLREMRHKRTFKAVRGVLDLLCHDESLIMRRRAGLTDFVALDLERKIKPFFSSCRILGI